MMYVDTVQYLPDDILAKVDRVSMRVGLEVRIPYLDHRVVEFVWRLPVRMRTGGDKRMLRRILQQYLPPDLVDTRKRGFAVPMAGWLRGPLRDWAEGLLDEFRLQRTGSLESAAVRSKWAEHLAGRLDRSRYLWPILMFQSWIEEFQE